MRLRSTSHRCVGGPNRTRIEPGATDRKPDSDRTAGGRPPWSGAQTGVPALYVVGDRDLVYHFPGGGPQLVTNLSRSVPNLKQGVVLEGCGHCPVCRPALEERTSWTRGPIAELLIATLAPFICVSNPVCGD
jgi:pimeloyl-ACP methyl ester carboxylesterase